MATASYVGSRKERFAAARQCQTTHGDMNGKVILSAISMPPVVERQERPGGLCETASDAVRDRTLGQTSFLLL